MKSYKRIRRTHCDKSFVLGRFGGFYEIVGFKFRLVKLFLCLNNSLTETFYIKTNINHDTHCTKIDIQLWELTLILIQMPPLKFRGCKPIFLSAFWLKGDANCNYFFFFWKNRTILSINLSLWRKGSSKTPMAEWFLKQTRKNTVIFAHLETNHVMYYH